MSLIPIGTVLKNDILDDTLEYRIVRHGTTPTMVGGTVDTAFADEYQGGKKMRSEMNFCSRSLDWLLGLHCGWRVVSQAKPVSAGLKCGRCQEFYPYAEPNQPDGTLKCWSCRQ